MNSPLCNKLCLGYKFGSCWKKKLLMKDISENYQKPIIGSIEAQGGKMQASPGGGEGPARPFLTLTRHQSRLQQLKGSVMVILGRRGEPQTAFINL